MGANASSTVGTATDALTFFGRGPTRNPAAQAILKRVADVGPGYLRLGQPLTTLSGGERQRLTQSMAR